MDKYLHYTLEDFLTDDLFLTWVKGGNSTVNAQWQTWLSEHPSKMETLASARAIVSSLSAKETSQDKATEDRIWQNIAASTKTQSKKLNLRERLYRSKFSIAATLLILVGSLFYHFQTDTSSTIQTTLAMTKTDRLPDGSMVYVNADSKLSYDADNWQQARELTLDGEAYFEVQKGSTFTVNTQHGKVQVLGTSFNVYARGGVLKVFCETGKVAVISENMETTLLPQQGVEVVGNIHSKSTNTQASLLRSQWRKGMFVYDNQLLQNVLEDLELTYSINIDSKPEYDNLRYTGSFKNLNLETALSEVFWPLNIAYKVDGDRVQLSSK